MDPPSSSAAVQFPQLPKFLRVLQAFHPTCDSDGSSDMLPLNPRNLILIHSIGVEGWAEGTLLDSYKRGWFPTACCESYNPEPLQSLLQTLVNFWDIIESSEEGTIAILHGENLENRLRAGSKYLLVNQTRSTGPRVADCMV